MTDAVYLSERLGTLSQADLAAAVADLGLGELTQVAPVLAGNFGQNALLDTSKGSFVFRGKPHDDIQFKRERFFANLLHDNTEVAVPWPYLLVENTERFGYPYIVMPKMPGLCLTDDWSDTGLDLESLRSIARAMGHTLACLHGYTHADDGEYDLARDAIRPLGEDHFTFVAERLEPELVRSRETMSRSDQEWVRSQLERSRDDLLRPHKSTFVMQDFKPSNLVVLREETGWRVSGVFDFSDPLVNNGEMDLPRMMYCCLESDIPCLASDFVAGYYEAESPSEGVTGRLLIYAIFDRIVIWNFGWRHGPPWWNPNRTFREWLDVDSLMNAFQQGASGGRTAPLS